MRPEIRRMTGEVIKTGTTSLLSLSLNMNRGGQLGYVDVQTHVILRRGSLCLLLDVLALSYLAGTIEMQAEGYG